MRSSATSVLFAVALSCYSLPAQVSVAVQALTPITVVATDGAASVTTTQPAGPLLPTSLFDVTSSLGPLSPQVFFGGGAEASNNEAYCNLGFACSNTTPTAVTTVNTCEVLATFVAAVPTPIRFDIDLYNVHPAGATVPSVQVDVDNDGTIDFANGIWINFFGPRTIGPAGIQFRVIMQGTLQQQGEMIEDLSLKVVPDNRIYIYPAAIGCIGTGPGIRESFLNTGITIRNNISSSYPRVFVFGLATQPVLLPTVSSVPCLLVPRPDVVMVIPTFSSVELAMPQSVRPVSVWIQNVELHGSDLYTGYGSQAFTY